DAVLGPTTTRDLDAELGPALARAIRDLEPHAVLVKKTQDYIDFAKKCLRKLERGWLRWGDWALLAKCEPSKKLLGYIERVAEIAGQHIAHPRLRADMRSLIERLFEIAATALVAYRDHKRALGVIDFGDQEALALQLLRRDDVRAALAGQLDLFLVDEFQDTSPIQLAVFLELAALAKESIWVGDPKQAIFGFRGTDPALMDSAIESLTSVTTDGDLVEAATRAVASGTVETLDVSYRSRPGLVKITSEIFARAFEHQGIPPERTKLRAALATEPAGLGDLVELWPLLSKNAPGRAEAVAAGVRDLLARGARVRARDGTARAATRSDLAVLCRTNAQCRDVADALGALGIAAVVPRVGLVDTHEALVVLAGLALWIDPRDSLAAAELARIITYPTDLDAFTAQALAAPGEAAFAADPTVVRILAARDAERDLGPLGALDAVMAATQVRRLCAEWGSTAQRIANLDALRAHAAGYVEAALSSGRAATVVGLVGHLAEIGAEATWQDQRSDSQAMLSNEDAVTISTWHAAKGLEWGITILFGLESIREASSWGVHVLTDRDRFEVGDPLGGRWVRYWPFPYTKSNQGGPVCDAVDASAGHGSLVDRAAREALRVLYVGWTRARDRLVFAVAPGKLHDGIVGTLSAIDPALISEPPGDLPGTVDVTWAGEAVRVAVHPVAPAEDEPAAREPGDVTIGVAPTVRARARVLPSESATVPAAVGAIIDLGPRLAVTGSPDMESVGHAVHGFLAADVPGSSDDERLALAARLLDAFGLTGTLSPADLLVAASRLWSWCDATFPGSRRHREWPLSYRRAEGTIVAGTADLVLSGTGGFVLVDHKSFPGDPGTAPERALRYAGQLHAYAVGVASATRLPFSSAWIHFPLLGKLVEVKVDIA
ncbi:MAG: UvrD-helicase domain-containing protein, partial [Myxococcales bacterium]|nr:UvrD-helicase domain-containing protein [Myxococcales bacterium]